MRYFGHSVSSILYRKEIVRNERNDYLYVTFMELGGIGHVIHAVYIYFQTKNLWNSSNYNDQMM